MCALIDTNLTPATADAFGRHSYASVTLRDQSVPLVELAAANSNSVDDKRALHSTPNTKFTSITTD